MGTAASVLIDEVLLRVRDSGATAHPRATVLALLSRAQQALNAIIGAYTASASDTPGTGVFQDYTSVDSSSVIDIYAATDGTSNKFLNVVPFSDMKSLGADWPTPDATNPNRTVISIPSKTHYVVYPIHNSGSGTVTLYYTKLPTALALEADTMDLDPEYDDILVDLTELLLYLRQRDLEQFQKVYVRFQQQLAFHARRRLDRLGF